ncbi:MAG: DUF3108 domain-containing protein [Rhodocyclaceae bacterium]
MPFALIFAFAASLGVHALALFGTDVELSTTPAPPPLVAELQPPPRPKSAPSAAAKPPAKPPARPKPSPLLPSPPVPQASAATLPDSPAPEEAAVESTAEATAESPEAPPIEAAAPESRLPARGMIRYRVDRGDQGFAVGVSTHDWEVVDGAYRITALTETSGLAALFKPLRIELESRGRLTAEGLQPESFSIRRDGRETREKAVFDWTQMTVRIADSAAQALSHGAQDLLSFHYQLGFLPHPAADNTLPIATGKKYETYRIESLGDEEIEIPAGKLRTLHLRAPGDNTTELWLAYDYLLLPVKIRHLDRDGDSFVQVATEIRLSKE